MSKDKRKLDKRLKKFNERRCILNERKKYIQIVVNKCYRSIAYFDMINHAIKCLDSKILKDMAKELVDMGSSAFKSDLYEKYRVLVAEELWKVKEIQLKFPSHFFYVYKSNTSLLLWIDIRSFDYSKDYHKSPEDIIVNHNGIDYKLYWYTHAVDRLIERYKDNSYASYVDIAFVLYFLNWFDIKVHRDGKYLCIYMVNDNNKKQCDLIGIGPIILEDDKMIVKTFLPHDFISNYGLNRVIAKPDKYASKCHKLAKVGYSEPLYKSHVINRWGGV